MYILIFLQENGTMLSKKFFVTFPENSMIYGDDIKQTYEEFEVELTQCGVI